MNKKIMNQIVKIVSEKQNDKLKLNSGQIREMISLIFASLYDLDLTVLQIKEGDMAAKKKASKKVAAKKTATKKK